MVCHCVERSLWRLIDSYLDTTAAWCKRSKRDNLLSLNFYWIVFYSRKKEDTSDRKKWGRRIRVADPSRGRDSSLKEIIFYRNQLVGRLVEPTRTSGAQSTDSYLCLRLRDNNMYQWSFLSFMTCYIVNFIQA